MNTNLGRRCSNVYTILHGTFHIEVTKMPIRLAVIPGGAGTVHLAQNDCKFLCILFACRMFCTKWTKYFLSILFRDCFETL